MTALNLFVSRLVLPASAPGHLGRQDLHAVHNALWGAFRELPQGAPRPFLFRADRIVLGERTRAWKVLVQSSLKADWAPLGAVEAEQREASVAPAAGEKLRFFLRANPVVSVKGKEQHIFADLDRDAFRAARGHKVAVRGEEALTAWLGSQGERHGFLLEGVRLQQQHRESWRAKSSAGGHAVHEGVDFEGHLRVVDEGLLLGALASGLGRGRGFGFGLLSLARERV